MQARLQILESKDQDLISMQLESTGNIGYYDSTEEDYCNDLIRAFDYLSQDLEKT